MSPRAVWYFSHSGAAHASVAPGRLLCLAHALENRFPRMGGAVSLSFKTESRQETSPPGRGTGAAGKTRIAKRFHFGLRRPSRAEGAKRRAGGVTGFAWREHAANRPETRGPSRKVSRAQPDLFPASVVGTAPRPARPNLSMARSSVIRPRRSLSSMSRPVVTQREGLARCP